MSAAEDSSTREPIVLERVFDAAVDRVFRAWSDAESMARWMCPGDVARTTATLDFQVGGRFQIVMHGAERDFAHEGRYLEIDPPRRLAFTWVSTWLPEAERATRVRVEFEALGDDRTRLTLVHDELPAGDAYAGHDAGWKSILEKLAAAPTLTPHHAGDRS
ncbi:MAG: SRPBCC domain-containing protein [Proteobacteria bacterium]|nr:SRPBCC domain-containing protein [Pseudomonadota bacterium]